MERRRSLTGVCGKKNPGMAPCRLHIDHRGPCDDQPRSTQERTADALERIASALEAVITYRTSVPPSEDKL